MVKFNEQVPLFEITKGAYKVLQFHKLECPSANEILIKEN